MKTMDTVTQRILERHGRCAFRPVVVLLLMPTAAAAYLSFAAMGVAGGMFVLANSTVWARTYGTEQLGRMQGLGFGAMIGGAAVGPVLLASSHSATGSYVPGIIGLAGLAGASFLAGIGRREPQPVPSAV